LKALFIGFDGIKHVAAQMRHALDVHDVRTMFEHARIHFRAVGLHDPNPRLREEVMQDGTATIRRELEDNRLLVRTRRPISLSYALAIAPPIAPMISALS
jgi:hypothetical protein